MNINWDDVDDILEPDYGTGPSIRDSLAKAGYQIVRREIIDADIPHLDKILGDGNEEYSGREIRNRLEAAGYAVVSKAMVEDARRTSLPEWIEISEGGKIVTIDGVPYAREFFTGIAGGIPDGVVVRVNRDGKSTWFTEVKSEEKSTDAQG